MLPRINLYMTFLGNA